MVTENEAINEILNDEEMQQAAAAVTALIDDMLRENAGLRDINGKQAALIFDLMGRIDDMLRIAKNMTDGESNEAFILIDLMTRAGSHRDRDQDAMNAAGRLARMQTYMRQKFDQLARRAAGDSVASGRDMDDIPF